LDRYGYSKEEILFLDQLARQTEVRGADIRYWEDVKVGDTLNPVVIGPTNFQDIGSMGMGGSAPGGADTGGSVPGGMAGGRGGRTPEEKKPVHQLLEKKGVIKREEYIQDARGYFYKSGGDMMRHWDDVYARAEGEPGAFLWGLMSIKTMTRCITNWMGDDGFVRKYCWRHVTRTMVGDAAFSLGKVTDKRHENGEYLVDIFVYHQDIRGYVVDAAVATVALPSKKTPYPDTKKVIKY
jgi:hypothetical protein